MSNSKCLTVPIRRSIEEGSLDKQKISTSKKSNHRVINQWTMLWCTYIVHKKDAKDRQAKCSRSHESHDGGCGGDSEAALRLFRV